MIFYLIWMVIICDIVLQNFYNFFFFVKEFSESPLSNEELPEIIQKVPMFLKMKSKFKDEVLLETVMKILKFYCTNRNYEEKRDTGKVVGKKIKFFSWGGK